MPILQPTRIILDELIKAISVAQKEILLQTYYITHDEVFNVVAEKLIEKAQSGVPVYCLFDALGAKEISDSNLEKKMLAAGIRIQYFNWLTPWAGGNKKIWYFRNHKRSLIIDNQHMYTGGWCIGTKTQDWIEASLQSSNIDVVKSTVSDFWNMYVYAHRTQLRFKHQRKYTYSDDKEISYVYQSPLLHGRYMYHTHKKLMCSAATKIVLVTPYFAPTHTLKKHITDAQKRGVAVEIFLPRKTDIRITDLVAKTYIHGLLKAGVSVYLSDTMIHAKAGLFDDVLYIGSANLDPVSLRYNFENGIYTKDITTVQEFEADVQVLRSICEHITLEVWEKRTLWEKFLDKFMKIFRAFV